MNKRLQQFLSAENISQAQFADTIDVARASVSHVLAGRNKPGYDFIKSITDHYPKLSLDWLINGKGKMYREGTGDLAVVAEAVIAPQPEPAQGFEDDLFAQNDDAPAVSKPISAPLTERVSPTRQPQVTDSQRSISKIVVFYDDGTYQELK